MEKLLIALEHWYFENNKLL